MGSGSALPMRLVPRATMSSSWYRLNRVTSGGSRLEGDNGSRAPYLACFFARWPMVGLLSIPTS